MSKILERPDYIKYRQPNEYDSYTQEDINILEAEPALTSWDVPNAFFWSTRAWVHHTLILFIPVGLVILFYLSFGFTGVSIIVFCIFTPLYYIQRSQYYHIGYKITNSGLLIDNLKRYPRFRYGNQDTTGFIKKLRVVAVILIIVAIMINPLYLIGAGSAIFLSFMKPQTDEGERAIYEPCYWKLKEHPFTIVNVIPSRRIIYLDSENIQHCCPIFCTKENFDSVLAIVKEKLPDAEYVKNQPVFK